MRPVWPRAVAIIRLAGVVAAMGVGAELPPEDALPIDADKLRALLRRKYPADQFAMLYEVRDAAGFAAKRYADVTVIALPPSRALPCQRKRCRKHVVDIISDRC